MTAFAALHALAARAGAIVSANAGRDLAADRGNLSADEEAALAASWREHAALDAEGRAAWAALPEAEVAAFDRAVAAVLARVRDAGGVLAHVHLADLAPRAAATLAPGRAWDPWVVRVVGDLRLDDLRAGVSRLRYLRGCIAYLSWAEDRGHLPAAEEVELRAFVREADELDARLRPRWLALAPDAVAAYDAAALPLLEQLPDAAATRSPTRRWDAAAIDGVLERAGLWA